MAARKTADPQQAKPTVELDVESASRIKDPYEQTFLGVINTNDQILIEKGQGNYDIYRKLKTNAKVFDGLQKRTLALVGYEWMVEPADKSADATSADLVTLALKKCSFDQVCKDLMEALLVGMSVCEIVWTYRDGWIVPARIVKRKPSRFVFVQNDEHKPPELRLLTQKNMVTGEELPQRKFIVHRVNAEDDNPYGNGLGAQSYWPDFFMRKGLVAWNKLLERLGIPTRVGYYPRNAQAAEKVTLNSALSAFNSDGSLSLPEGTKIELLESKLTGGITTYRELCDFMNEWLDAVWLGKETGGASGGAQAAAAKERSDIRLALTKGDADLLSATLNDTLIKWMCELNGWEPCLVYRQIKEEVDLKAESETDKNVAGMGFELSEEGARAKYGEYWSKKQADSLPPAPAVNQPLKLVHDKAVSMAEASIQPDAIDDLVDAEIAAWEPIMAPMVEPLRKLLKQAADDGLTAAQLLDRLPALLPQMNAQPLDVSLTSTAFAARLASLGGARPD